MWRPYGAAYRRGMTTFIVRNTGRVIYEERVAAGIRAAELHRLSAPRHSRRPLSRIFGALLRSRVRVSFWRVTP
jgi:hypothetical protein